VSYVNCKKKRPTCFYL